jgi:hypothetical protein
LGGEGYQPGIIKPEQQFKGSLVAVNESLYQGFLLNPVDDSHGSKCRKSFSENSKKENR